MIRIALIKLLQGYIKVRGRNIVSSKGIERFSVELLLIALIQMLTGDIKGKKHEISPSKDSGKVVIFMTALIKLMKLLSIIIVTLLLIMIIAKVSNVFISCIIFCGYIYVIYLIAHI